jgi:hypothetical protein
MGKHYLRNNFLYKTDKTLLGSILMGTRKISARKKSNVLIIPSL